MAHVVSLTDLVPSPRYDELPWTQVDIQEAPLSTGPWTTLETQSLFPYDIDPEHPEARSVTTDQATLTDGWYRVIFRDATGNDQLPTVPISYETQGEVNFYPTVKDVAMFNRSRTKDAFGNEVGTFTGNTKPTDTDVMQLIPVAAQRVADVVGDDVPEQLWDDTASVIALRAAMQVELDYYADQVNTGRSIYPQLKELYDEDLSKLQSAVAAAEAGDGSVVSTSPGTKASFSFPDSNNWLGRRW